MRASHVAFDPIFIQYIITIKAPRAQNHIPKIRKRDARTHASESLSEHLEVGLELGRHLGVKLWRLFGQR
jgi:hypothetical protein